MSMVTEEMVRTIAAMLDHPNVYMGGPSQRNMRRAEQIIAAAAPIIAAQERERCALVADEEEAYHYKAIPVENLTSDDPIACPARQRTQVAGTIAAAIRALEDET